MRPATLASRPRASAVTRCAADAGSDIVAGGGGGRRAPAAAGTAARRRRALRAPGRVVSLDGKLEEQRLLEQELAGGRFAMPREGEEGEAEEADEAAEDEVEYFDSDPNGPPLPPPPPLGAAPAAAEPAAEVEVEVEAAPAPRAPGAPPLDEVQRRANERVARKAAALLEIMQAGEGVEEAIARHLAEVDGEMLSLLAGRIEAARKLERRQDVLDGLAALWRRLKAEADRAAAPPALRLLDSLLAILDGADAEEEEAGGGAGGDDTVADGGAGGGAEAPPSPPPPAAVTTKAELDARRGRAAARLRTAFSGAPVGVDVLNLASRLAADGARVSEQLLEESVEPQVFAAEAGALLDGALEQQRALEAALAERADLPAAERAAGEALAARRATAIARVQEVMALARTVAQQQGGRI
jgi:hypothetical protein